MAQNERHIRPRSGNLRRWCVRFRISPVSTPPAHLLTLSRARPSILALRPPPRGGHHAHQPRHQRQQLCQQHHKRPCNNLLHPADRRNPHPVAFVANHRAIPLVRFRPRGKHLGPRLRLLRSVFAVPGLPFPTPNAPSPTLAPLIDTSPDEIQTVVRHFNNGSLNPFGGAGFVHYFNTTGILQHNDIGPLYHPTDVGHIKLASHLIQYIHQTFGWEMEATGPEVQHETLYWNDMPNY